MRHIQQTSTNQMIDQAKASELAKEAFRQSEAGQYEHARQLYEEAIALSDPQYFMLAGYYREYACTLNRLGQHDQATKQLETALATEIAQGEVEGSPAVTIARYFLADQLLRLGNNERALETLSPSIMHAPRHWLTWLEQAHILYALDRKAEARSAAVLAVEYAPTLEKAEQLRQNLAVVLDNHNAQP